MWRYSAAMMLCFLRGVGAFAQAPAPSCSPALLFVSDTQKPMWVETLWLKSHGNEQATAALFSELLAQEPTGLFFLGDVVNLGFKQKRWVHVDKMLKTARELGFKVHGLLGNHEVMRRPAAGERAFQARFSEHVRTGYCVRQDSVAVVMLNSNFDKLTREEQEAQRTWYTSTLAALDTAMNVRAVIVCCHHSPYSDSRIVGSNADVQRVFVAPFLQRSKTTLFISGHAHLFEHFSDMGKHFFVIGGGGGLHHPLSKDRGMKENLDPEYDPLFHYLSVQRCGERLVLVSRRLKDDFSGFEDGRTFELDTP